MKCSMRGQEKVTFSYKWLLNRGGLMGRFDCFIYFFVLQETQKETSEAVSLDAFLMNGYKITVKIMSTDQTEDVLEV